MNEKDILEDFQESLKTITDRDINRSKLQLAPPSEGEKPLGVVASEVGIRYWALADKLEGMASKLMHAARHTFETNEEKEQYTEGSHQAAALSELARDIAWLYFRHEIGRPSWLVDCAGLRADWTMVDHGTRHGKEVAAFQMALPSSIGKALQAMFSGKQPLEDIVIPELPKKGAN